MTTRRLLTYAIGAVIAATLFLLLTLRLASDPTVKANLGSDVFRAGRTDVLAREIARHGPVLFPDPTGKGRDVLIDHAGTDRETGWRATLRGSAQEFPTRVEKGYLVVDVRAGPPRASPSKSTRS